MSGGVDSSIAAHLLVQEGYPAKGAMLKLYDDNKVCDVNQKACRTCCSADDAEDARRVAAKLGIDFFVLNYKDVFNEKVIKHFISEYLAGRTPNPCIDCNRFIKFGELLRRLPEYECDLLATGHYARIEKQNDRYILKKATDSTKDQSYVLYSLTQDQLAKTLFPLGNLTKKEVREIAAECNFVNKNKPDSQDICFVLNGNYAEFIERVTSERRGGRPRPPIFEGTTPVVGEGLAPPTSGHFLDTHGNILGTHNGFYNFTIGQRKGIGIAFAHPMYVQRIDAANNNVILCENHELYADTLKVTDLNLIALNKLSSPLKCEVKIRYNSQPQSATIEQINEEEILVKFKEPQRAITPGQIAVFYDADTVLGGGIIV